MAPKPNVAPSTSQICGREMSAHSSVESVTAKMMRIPPIVGVPLFAR